MLAQGPWFQRESARSLRVPCLLPLPPELLTSSSLPEPASEAPGSGGQDCLDVLIVGGGVCGTALLFELARYTDLNRLALGER